MHVHWLLPAAPMAAAALASSHLASVRLRAAVALERLAEQGVGVSAGDAVDPRADTVVVGKIGADCGDGRADRWLQALQSAREAGRRLLLDYTDHHLALADGAMPAFYRAALPRVHQVVVPSPHMQRLLDPHHDGPVSVIEDAIEVPVLPPRPGRRSDPPTLLWFGHGSNLGFLVDWLERRCTAADRFGLLVLSGRGAIEHLARHPPRTPAALTMRAAEWSPQAMLQAAGLSDGCVIPSDPGHPLKSGASANRLITALALGLPTAADPLSAYRPFAEHFFDLSQGPVHGFVGQLDHFAALARVAQQQVVPAFGRVTVGERWAELLRR